MAVGIVARGRIAWILSIILGVILCIVGAVTGPNTFLLIAGAAFLLFGIVMLIISLVTKGAAD